MDDSAFQEWSETLAELRQTRRGSIDEHIKSRGGYSPKEFFDSGMSSLDQIMSQWWNTEKTSWTSHPPSDAAAELAKLKGEMDSLIEFELEALGKDLEFAKGQSIWNDDEVHNGLGELYKFAEELKSNYAIKMDALGMENKKKDSSNILSSLPSSGRPVSMSGSSSGPSSVGLLGMLFLGIILGGGGSVYFWDAAKKAQSASQEKLSSLMDQKRQVEDSIALFQQSYAQLALGKIKNIPELERTMKPIHDSYDERRANVEKEFSVKKATVSKKVPAGDKQDRSFAKLKQWRDDNLSTLNSQEKSELEPYQKQIKVLKELMGN